MYSPDHEWLRHMIRYTIRADSEDLISRRGHVCRALYKTIPGCLTDKEIEYVLLHIVLFRTSDVGPRMIPMRAQNRRMAKYAPA